MRFLQPLEQFARSPPWLGLKPFAQQLRHPCERVGTPTPAGGLFLRLAGRAHLAVLPCRAQSGQELLQRRSGRLRRFANDRPVGECNQLLLDFTDRFQQSNRVQCGISGRCAATDVLVAPRIGQQSLIGRGRGMICLADLRAITNFSSQLERRLKVSGPRPARRLYNEAVREALVVSGKHQIGFAANGCGRWCRSWSKRWNGTDIFSSRRRSAPDYRR